MITIRIYLTKKLLIETHTSDLWPLKPYQTILIKIKGKIKEYEILEVTNTTTTKPKGIIQKIIVC